MAKKAAKSKGAKAPSPRASATTTGKAPRPKPAPAKAAPKPKASPPAARAASKQAPRPKPGPSRRTNPNQIRIREGIAGRLREIRRELFGDHGGPELARRLNLPARTWYNYESGVTVPAEVLLAFIEQTHADPWYVLTGQGPRYRPAAE